MPNSVDNVHQDNSIQTNQPIFNNVHVHSYTYMHGAVIKKIKATIYLKKCNKCLWEDLEEGEGSEKWYNYNRTFPQIVVGQRDGCNASNLIYQLFTDLDSMVSLMTFIFTKNIAK